jgi:electron transfer flavoprotein-quinone oxidoreductase
MSYDFDLIIVGGGLAGLSASITAAREGLSVLVLERGEYSGAKNLAGGRIYIHSLKKLFPDLWERRPELERPVTEEKLTFLCGEKSLNLSFRDEGGKENSYTILRAKFDRWLAKEAEKEGVNIIYSTLVKDIIEKENRVEGVITYEGDEVRAPVIIAADGVVSHIARKAGIRSGLREDELMIGVKEVVKTSKQIEEGVAETIVNCTKGLEGGCFLYTNKETVSIGATILIGDIIEARRVRSHEVVEELRHSKYIQSFLGETEVLEYSAHLIPYKPHIDEIAGKGVLVAGDAAGMLINDGFNIRGMDLAIGSGMIAGKASSEFKRRGGNDVELLSKLYKNMIEDSFIYRDIKRAEKTMETLRNLKGLYGEYPEKICSLLSKFYTVDGNPRGRFISYLSKDYRMLSDLIKLVLSL